MMLCLYQRRMKKRFQKNFSSNLQYDYKFTKFFLYKFSLNRSVKFPYYYSSLLMLCFCEFKFFFYFPSVKVLGNSSSLQHILQYLQQSNMLFFIKIRPTLLYAQEAGKVAQHQHYRGWGMGVGGGGSPPPPIFKQFLSKQIRHFLGSLSLVGLYVPREFRKRVYRWVAYCHRRRIKIEEQQRRPLPFLLSFSFFFYA